MRAKSSPSRSKKLAVLIAGPALALGLLAAPASAAATATDSSSLLPSEAGDGGFYDDLNDIAGLMSGVLGTALNLTCLDQKANIIICRVNTDNTPVTG